MSTRQLLINAATKHQVFLQRYAGSVGKELISFIKQIKIAAQKTLETSPELTTMNKFRFQQLIVGLKDLNSALVKDMVKGIKSNMTSLAEYEADFTNRLIRNSTTLDAAGFETIMPSIAQLKAAAFTNVMDATIPGYDTNDGLTVQAALSQYGANAAGNVVTAIRQGFATGSTLEDVSSNIGDILDAAINARQAATLARTITNHVASTSRQEFFDSNSDIITGYQIVATLDNRTTLTCAALDGQVFAVDDFDAPPYHWNCRTTFIGVVDPEYSIDITGVQRPANGDDGEDLVSTQTTYNSWLKNQSDEFQNEVLGPERADMFRGGMSLDQFVDHNYTPYTLDELKAKDEEHN